MTVTDRWASYFARRTVLSLTSAPNSTRNYRIFRLRSRRWKKSRKSSMIPEANLWCVMMDAVSLVQRESVFFWTSLPIRHARNSLVIGKCLTSSHTCLLWVRLLFSRVYTKFLGYTHRHDPSLRLGWISTWRLKIVASLYLALQNRICCTFFFGIARQLLLNFSYESATGCIFNSGVDTRNLKAAPSPRLIALHFLEMIIRFTNRMPIWNSVRLTNPIDKGRFTRRTIHH